MLYIILLVISQQSADRCHVTIKNMPGKKSYFKPF